MPSRARHIIIGAGPAGLTAAWQLARLGESVQVLEADSEYVGGLSRTVEDCGHRFDLGGHRFYSKSEVINETWQEMLPHDFIEVPRRSRIYYGRRFFPYPVELGATLRALGPARSVRILASCVRARLRPRRPEVSFEDWVVNRFGRDLYDTFFRTYTEKVWGIPCSEMSKDFAAQRIRGLSLVAAIADRVRRSGNERKAATLIDRFLYPRLGPGQLWEAVRDEVVDRGGCVSLDKRVTAVRHQWGVVTEVETTDGEVYEGEFFYPTLPLRELVGRLEPPPPAPVLEAALGLRFRDFLTVVVVVDQADVFPDTWIYVHDPHVRVGRIQNYKNWSSEMVTDPGLTCLGLEYFCSRDDDLWELDDEELVQLAVRELEIIGLVGGARCVKGSVTRVPDAYPVYDAEYREHRATIRAWLEANLENVFPAGRGGLHNYNSQDHAMMTALLSVRNALEAADFDVWAINTEEEYAEAGASAGVDGRLVPTRLPGEAVPANG